MTVTIFPPKAIVTVRSTVTLFTWMVTTKDISPAGMEMEAGTVIAAAVDDPTTDKPAEAGPFRLIVTSIADGLITDNLARFVPHLFE